MTNSTKLHAKLEKAEARAERHLAALRAKAEKKIAKIQDGLRSDEADVEARLEADRAKYQAKLDRARRKAGTGDGAPAIEHPRPRKLRSAPRTRRAR